MKSKIIFASVVAAAAGGFAFAQSSESDQAPGKKFKFEVASLAQPNATPSASNSSKTVEKPANATLQVPAGFKVNVFAEKLANARNMAVAANGDVILAESRTNKLTLLRDANNDGKADTVETFAEGFRIPYGLAIGKGALYVGDQDGVWRIPYVAGDTKAKEKQTKITPDGAFGSPGGHSTRNLALSADGTKLYVAIGSASNIAEDPMPRATIQVFDLNAAGTQATNQRTYATGLRNPVGVGFYPGTQDLYTVVNERDTLGDELVPDYFTKVADAGFYGWPYSYIGKNPQPGLADKRPDLVQKAIVPDVLFRSHSAPLGFAFYTGTQFPKEYQGGAFVALHGSWNAGKPRAYNVAYIPFANGKPAGDYQVFASGFWSGTGDRAEVWGRPADVEVAKDGSLLIADDTSNTIFRVSYGK
jgi:glucose/arabinose dehydrogenase